MGRWIGYVETAITWLERTPWGQRLIAGAVAAAISAWTWLEVRYPLPVLVILFIALTWMLLDIEARVVKHASERLAPPLRIEATNMVMTTGVGQTDSQRAMRWIDVPMYVLNRSKARRVSLVIAMEVRPSNMGPCRLDSSMIQIVGLRLNLGPEEETRGGIRFYVPDINMQFEPHLIAGDFFYLLVSDRISGRSAHIRIPGVYPQPGAKNTP